ncbi:MAG: RluA family pseudouridine synthase [Clostridiales bacterium]|nr:RluA family pseudouridine synthase [Clostridiales bacterium]
MRDFTVSKAQDGLHVVKASQEAFPQLKSADLFHALKRRDIRIDGKKINKDIAVKAGNVVEIWLPDVLFDAKNAQAPAKPDEPMFEIVAETKGLLIVNKSQGIAVHSGRSDIDDTLIDLIRETTKYKDAELCHRIDMNTGGLVLIAKNKQALADCVELFKNNLVTKRYRALVLGEPDEGEPAVGEDGTIYKEVKGYLEKTKAGKVYIHDDKHPGDLDIATKYKILKTFKDAGPDGESVSDLELELVTGRTHQIRAQFAHLGHPVIGDGNYGRNKVNMHFETKDGKKVRYQQLFSCQILFGRIPKNNMHVDVSGKTYKILPDYNVKLAK